MSQLLRNVIISSMILARIISQNNYLRGVSELLNPQIVMETWFPPHRGNLNTVPTI